MSEYTPNNHHESDEPNKEALDALFRQKMAETRLNVPSMTTAPEAVVFGYTLAANKDLAEQLQQFEDTQIAPDTDEQLALTAGKSKELVVAEKSKELLIDPAHAIHDAEVVWEEINDPEDTDSAPETDAYGNPVQHEHQWSRTLGAGPAAISAFKPYGELPQYTTQPDRKPDAGQLAIEAKKPEFIVSDELNETYRNIRDRYAELTVRDRRSALIGRYTKDPRSWTGKILRAIPGVKQLSDKAIDFMNGIQGEEINEAREAYHNIVKQLEDEFEKFALENGYSNQDVLIGRALLVGDRDQDFEDRQLELSSDMSKSNGLVKWWVDQKGLKGKMLKGGVVAVAGAAAGSVAMLALPTLAASAVAAGTGAAIGQYINKKRANTAIEATNSDGSAIVDAAGNATKRTIAEQHTAHDKEAKAKLLDEYKELVKNNRTEARFSIKQLTDITEKRSNQEAFENRSRVRKAMGAAGLGFSTVKAAGFAFDALTNDAGAQTPHTGPQEPKLPDPQQATTTPEALTLNGESFTVEYGNGYTQELTQFFQANGHNLSPQQSLDLHNSLVKEFGSNYIKDMGTYVDQSEVRLSAPKMNAQWVDGVAEFAEKWRIAHGIK